VRNRGGWGERTIEDVGVGWLAPDVSAGVGRDVEDGHDGGEVRQMGNKTGNRAGHGLPRAGCHLLYDMCT